jgi:hypothetical protein
MKNKIFKILGVVLTLAMLCSFMVATPASAAIGTNEWGKYTLPAVAPVSGVDQLEIAPNGDLYAAIVTTSDGLPSSGSNHEHWNLWKSTDGGVTWKVTKLDNVKLGDNIRITAIAVASDSKTVYVATRPRSGAADQARVWKCQNAGDADPFQLQALIDSSGINTADYIYDLEVWSDGVVNWVMAATNIDVLVLRDGLFEPWRDMDLSSSFGLPDPDGGDPLGAQTAVAYKAKFAPDFNTSFLIWALIGIDTTDAGTAPNYFVLTCTGANSPGQWGGVIKNANFTGLAGMTGTDWRGRVGFTFADGYTNANPVLFAALNDNNGSGNLFLCEFAYVVAPAATTITDLLDDEEMCSVQVASNLIVAGSREDNTVYISTNGGDTFDEAAKNPTGTGQVDIHLPAGYNPETGTAFCITRGSSYDESAVSRSRDGCDTWNQIAFIDTTIYKILDMTWTPDFPAGSYMLLLTYSDETDCISLWRSGNATAEKPFWERVLCGNGSEDYVNYDINEDARTLVEWSKDGSTVMLFCIDGSDEEVWKSSDSAQTFNFWRGLPADMIVNDWVVLDGVTFYAATSDGFYSRSAYGPPTIVNVSAGDELVSIALQPGFAPNDTAKDTLVVGDDDGCIFVSTDGGDTWGAANDIGSDNVYVAFDQLSAATIYYATGTSTVGTATIGPTTDKPLTKANMLASTSIKAFKDSFGGTATADSFSGIWVAPGALNVGGNVLYAIGGDEPTMKDLLYAWGRVTMDNDGGGFILGNDTAEGDATVVDNNTTGNANVSLFVDSGIVTDEALDASDTTITCDAPVAALSGATILIDDEQMLVTGTSGYDLTVTRGVNGTTAATHLTDAEINVRLVENLSVEDFLLVPISDAFNNDEQLNIIDDDDDTDTYVEVITDDIVAGRIYVEGDVSGAIGFIDVVFTDTDLSASFTDGDEVFVAEDNGANDWHVDNDEDNPVAMVAGEEVTEVEAGFDDGDTPDVTAHTVSVDEDFPTVVGGRVAIQNPVIGKGTFNASWDAQFGFENEDLGAPLDNFTASTIQIVVEEEEVSSETADLFRILIGEEDNVWETRNIDGAEGLWGTKGSNILWTVVDYDELWALKDTMATSIIGVTVTDVKETQAKVNWTALTGATKYEVKYDTVDITTDTAVTKTVSPTPPSTTPPTTITLKDLTNNTKYTAKVRVPADSPFQSRWSAAVPFTTLQTVGAPKNNVPVNGMQDAPLLPSFDWDDVTGAASYEFELGTAPDFVGATAVTSTVSQLTWKTALLYDTNYYWRVRAVGTTGAKGSWCVSNFHTRMAVVTPTTVITPAPTLTVSIPPAPPATTVIVSVPPATSVVIPPATTITMTTITQPAPILELPKAETPVYMWAIVAIGALLTLAVIVLIIRTRRVV